MVSLKGGDTVQVTMAKPHTKYKIKFLPKESGKSVMKVWTDGQMDRHGDCNKVPTLLMGIEIPKKQNSKLDLFSKDFSWMKYFLFL